MGVGYTRQSAAEIQTGEVVEAAPLNAEFNQLQSAFDGSLGHTHDGTVGEGPKINLSNSVSGLLQVLNGGINAIHNVTATTTPTVNDDLNDGYGFGSIWVNTSNKVFYVCCDPTPGAAAWRTFQPSSLGLTSIAGLTTSADKMIYTTASNVYAVTGLTAFIRTLLDDVDAAAARTTLGIGTLGAQNGNAVSITGGTITGITDLAIADGGTGASDITGAKTNLGLENVANKTEAQMVASGAIATALAGKATAAQGALADTAVQPGSIGTIASQNANSVAITGGSIAGITDLAVADGGTGASTASAARTNLGLGTISTANIFTGTGVPSNGTGVDGDIYFRT